MMCRAYEALALLYELRHPGEYAAEAGKLKEYVADNLRHVEQALDRRGLSRESFDRTALRLREVFAQVDGEIAAMRPADAARKAA